MPTEKTTPKYNFISLCAASDGSFNFLVKAPAYKVEIGDLVQFTSGRDLVTATVEGVTTIDEYSDTYAFLARHSRIRDAVRTFSLNWEAEEEAE